MCGWGQEGGPEAAARAWEHLPAVEIENPQPQRKVELHGWSAWAQGRRGRSRAGGPPCPALPGPRNASRLGGGRLLRYWDNRPSSHSERRSAANPGPAARGRRQSRKESRVDRSRFLGPSVDSRHRGLQVPRLAPGSASPATGSKLMRGPAHEPTQVPPLTGVGGGATRLP